VVEAVKTLTGFIELGTEAFTLVSVGVFTLGAVLEQVFGEGVDFGAQLTSACFVGDGG
jgi:hypothetical protein